MTVIIIHTGADDSINEYEIIISCISLSIIYTGADDSIIESEIIMRCMSISFTQEQMILSMMISGILIESSAPV